MLTHRQNARKKARRWQIAALACTAVAGAALFLPIGNVFSPKMVEIPTTDRSRFVQPDVPFGSPKLGMSVATLKELFPLVSPGGPGDEDDPVTEVSQDKTQIPPAPPPPVGVWEYIGSIITPTSKRAFVRVDQQQHLVTEGAGVNETKVVAIAADQLTIETQGVRTVVALNTRTMDFPTTPPKKPVAFRTPPNPGGPAGPGVVGGPNNPMARTHTGQAPPSMVTPPPQAPAAFDQMRAQAMNEAARRGQQAMDMPKRMSGEQLDSMRKLLSDGGLDPSAKREIMQKMGMKAGTPTDQTLQHLKESGIEVDESMMGAAKELEGMSGEMTDEQKKAEEAGKGG